MKYRVVMIQDEYHQNCNIEWGFGYDINVMHELFNWCVRTNASSSIYMNRKFIIEEDSE